MRAVAIAMFMASAVVSSCAHADRSFYVHNDSGENFYVRSQPELDHVVVVTLNAGTSGYAVSWLGTANLRIALLDLTCRELGVFDLSTGIVAGVAGVQGEVEPWSALPASGKRDLGQTEACGGQLRD